MALIFLGDDWAEEQHDVYLMDEAGKRLAAKRFPEGLSGIRGLHALIAEHAEEPGQVVVGIETDRGLWVDALVAAGYQVFAINPLAAARYRDRHHVSGAKSDPADAKLLADLVRTDRHNHRPVAGDSDAAAAVKVLARAHQSLIWARTRHTNMLRSALLVSAVGEVVAAVWVSPDERLRHYVIPWLPSWKIVLEWLAQQAIPEFVPSAVRRVHTNLGEDPALQTEAEKSALAARVELDEQYRIQREQLDQTLHEARAAADEVRFDLLYSRSKPLEDAVAAVLTDAGMTVVPLDSDLKNTASADLLVSYQARRRLVEVKSESGNASEKLVGDARKHLDTWSGLRPDVEVEGVSLIINHQIKSYPADRSDQAYTRPEFVESLTIPVTTTTVLFDAWRRRDLDAIRTAVFGAATPHPDHPAVEPESQPAVAVPRSPARTRRRWPWTRT